MVVSLAKPLNKTEDEILFDLPLARAYQYIAALGKQNGARVVWPGTYTTETEKLEQVRPFIRELLMEGFSVE